MHMLRLFFSIFGEFQTPPMGVEYELKRVELFTMGPFGHKYSWNDAEGDMGKKKIVLVRADTALVLSGGKITLGGVIFLLNITTALTTPTHKSSPLMAPEC